MKELAHKANDTSGGGFTREFSFISNNNQLANMNIGNISYDYFYDANGNIIQETGLRHFEWDRSDRMRSFYVQSNNSEPSIYSHYLYNSSGQRVKKLVRKQGSQNVEVIVYIDGFFEHTRITNGNGANENTTLNIMDDKKRIALVRVGEPFPDDNTP